MAHFKTLLRAESLRWNFAGNVAGRLWLGLLNLGSVPVFVHLLGPEAFGLVALVNTLQPLLALLDFGLAGTVNREVATLRSREARADVADVVRTLELVYWTVAFAIGLGMVGLSGWIAHSWLAEQALSPADVQFAIVLGGIALAARWPVALYTGVLQGLERQVLQNGVLIAAATTRIALTLMALLFVSRTVYCFLITQAVANTLEAILTGSVARRLANAGGTGKFSLDVVRRIWRFAVGFNLVGTFGMLLSATPQVLISKLLPLVELTYYSVAGTATGALQVIYIAANVSLFPRIAGCWRRQDSLEIRRLYLLGLRMTIYLCMGPALLLIFFPSEIITLWTRSPDLTQHVRDVLPILAIGVMANAAVAAPLIILLASGHTRLPLLVNIISFPVMVAGCYLATRAFGILGAAGCWVAWNSICFPVYAQQCFKQVFGGEARPVLWGLPFRVLLIGTGVAWLSHVFMPSHQGTLRAALWLSTTMLATYAGGMIMLDPEERRMLVAPVRISGSYFQKQMRKQKSHTEGVGL